MADELHPRHRPDVVADLIRGGDDRGAQVLQREAPALDRGLAGRPEHPQRFHRAGSVFREHDALTGKRCHGGGDRVERVVFAFRPPDLRVGAGHLQHRYPSSREVSVIPAPNEPVPSTPTRSTFPWVWNHSSIARLPGPHEP